jgi:hypothetical protein
MGMHKKVFILISRNYILNQVLRFFENTHPYDQKLQRLHTIGAVLEFAQNEFYNRFSKWAYTKKFNHNSDWPQWLSTCYMAESHDVFIERMVFEWKICSAPEKKTTCGRAHRLKSRQLVTEIKTMKGGKTP